jgi:hypothetical protein
MAHARLSTTAAPNSGPNRPSCSAWAKSANTPSMKKSDTASLPAVVEN